MSIKVLSNEVLANSSYSFKRHGGIWKTREKSNNKTKNTKSIQAVVSIVSQPKVKATAYPYMSELIVYINSYMLTRKVKAHIGFHTNLSIRERIHVLKE